MLTVAKVTSGAAGGYAEYLDGKTQGTELGDYYLKDGERVEAPGRWAGGAGLFDLDADAPVTGEQLRTLMDVRRPDTGNPLRRAGAGGEAVSAIDATFSAPKSVSAAWALAGAELRGRIEAAHETAVDRALAYATAQVPMIRRRVGAKTVVHEKAVGLVATSWRHTTARAVDQQVPDPQLHSHVLLHAAARRDRRVVAIDSRSWLVHQREVGAAYRTELAREMNRIGFAIQRGTGRGQRYFELADIPQGLLDRWSSRHHQVQAAIAQRLAEQGGGQLSPRQERMAAIKTRDGKTAVTTDDLDRQWRRAALQHGTSSERLAVICHQPRAGMAAADPDVVLAGLTEFDATFPAREARAVALERSAGAPIDGALEQLRELRTADEILVLADGTGTTRAHRGQERAVVAITRRLADGELEPLPAAAAVREADRLDDELAGVGGRLSGEQRAAIQLACGPRPLVVIEGQAGTGKSTTVTGIARAHQADGRQIIVTSTAALAAERLAGDLHQAGVDCRAYSIAALDAAVRRDPMTLGPETTVIHDEAALASTREQLRLLNAVETSGARLIEIGDPSQNQPVGAGGLWADIEHTVRDAGAHVTLTRNQRTRDPDDRRDQQLFRDGETEQAIRGYHDRDRVHIADTQQHAEDQALDAAHTDRTAGKHTIVIAQTSNEHLDELNARAQAIRLQTGQLGHDSVDVPGRPYRMHDGDHVQIRHTTAHPEHGQLRNGTTARVAGIDAWGRHAELELPDGRQLTLDQQQIAAADLRLAYVQHPFPAQGQTTDTAHLIVGEHTTQEGSYVALTRARDQTHIHAAAAGDRTADGDRIQELAERMGRTEPEVPSIRTPLSHEYMITASTQGDPTSIPTDPDRERRAETHAPSTTRVAANSPKTERSERSSDETEFRNDRRVWPKDAAREPTPSQDRHTRAEQDHSPGWEP